MKQPSRTRRLVFEPLETKASPSSLLLALAPLDEATQIAAEETRCYEEARQATTSLQRMDAHIARTDLLRFIDVNTAEQQHDLAYANAATPEQTQAAEEMMHAADTALRTMIVS